MPPPKFIHQIFLPFTTITTATTYSYHSSYNNASPPPTTTANTTQPTKQLLQAHVIFRHGSRTPVFYVDGIVSPQVAEMFRGKCQQVNGPPGVFPGDILPSRNKNEPRARLLTLRDLDGGPRPPSVVDRFQLTRVYGECRAGQLTDLGAEQSMNLGKTLYNRYKDLFHETRGKDGGLFLRTSNVARCVATLAYVLGEFEVEDDAEFKVLTAHNHVETLYPNSRCALTALLFDAARIDWSKNPSEETIATARILHEKLPPDVREKLKTDGYNFVRIRDYIVSYETHGLPLPWIGNDDEELVKRIEKLGAMQIARFLYHDTHLSDASSRAGIGSLLLIITDMMKMNEKKMSLISAHDTTLMPLLSACRVWDGETWPGFCSYITLEVWGSPNSSNEDIIMQKTVKLIFDDQILLETSLEEFLKRVQGVLPTPENDPCSVVRSDVELPKLPVGGGFNSKKGNENKDHW